jgi:hypothetical protein
MPLQYRGCDYSWARPDLQCLKNQGVRFIMRYGSRDPSKNLSKAELDKALSLGLSVGVFFQEGKTQMTRGYSGGQADALDARDLFDGLGLAGIPVYFACDYDPPSGDWPKIDAYLDGAASVIGRNRTGGYGGKAFISREFGNGKITWGCQTYAWSGSPTSWDGRAQLRQVQNDVTVCGGAIDWEEAWAADHGQWPRPGGSPHEGDMMSASSVILDGQLHMACVWSDGRVNYLPPSGGWYAVDPKAANKAKSGAHITANPQTGLLVISYTNEAGKVCTWQLAKGGGKNWAWYDRGGSAR